MPSSNNNPSKPAPTIPKTTNAPESTYTPLRQRKELSNRVLQWLESTGFDVSRGAEALGVSSSLLLSIINSGSVPARHYTTLYAIIGETQNKD